MNPYKIIKINKKVDLFLQLSKDSIHVTPNVYIWWRNKDKKYAFWDSPEGMAICWLVFTLEIRADLSK